MPADMVSECPSQLFENRGILGLLIEVLARLYTQLRSSVLNTAVRGRYIEQGMGS